MNKLLAVSLLVLAFLASCATGTCCGDSACADGACVAEAGTAMAGASVCVITGEPLDADSPRAEFMGTEIGFCCSKCERKWDGMDDAARQAAVAKLAKN